MKVTRMIAQEMEIEDGYQYNLPVVAPDEDTTRTQLWDIHCIHDMENGVYTRFRFTIENKILERAVVGKLEREKQRDQELETLRDREALVEFIEKDREELREWRHAVESMDWRQRLRYLLTGKTPSARKEGRE